MPAFFHIDILISAQLCKPKVEVWLELSVANQDLSNKNHLTHLLCPLALILKSAKVKNNLHFDLKLGIWGMQPWLYSFFFVV